MILLRSNASSILGAPRAGAAFNRMAWVLPAAYVGVLALVWFSTLGLRSLVSPDEGRYASLSLGMLQSGDWITPRLNGLLYFEKPVLQYWLVALAFKFFGVSEFSARLWPATAGFLTVLATGFTAGRLWGREAGLQTLAICASMIWILGNSLYLTLDSGLTLWLTLTLCSMLLAHREDSSLEARRRWILVAWSTMALAVLTKGLVGVVIPAGTLVLFCIWERNLTWWRTMHWLLGLLLFLVIAAPWFVTVSMRNPEFAEFFFIHEHFVRFLARVHRREGNWWYYVPFLLAGALPWTGALVSLAARSKRAAIAVAQAQRNGSGRPQDSQFRLLIVWAGFVLVFFSLSRSKLPSYILPMFPALALLLAMRLPAASPQAIRWYLSVPVAVWLMAVLVSTQVHRFASPNTPVSAIEPIAHAVRLGTALFLLGALAAWFCLRHGRMTAAVQSVALGHILAVAVVLQSHDSFGQLKSGQGPTKALSSYLDDRTPVFAVRSYDQSLPFYLRRDIVLVDYVDEFELGQRLEPGKSLSSVEMFIPRWAHLPKGAAYMSPAIWQELQQRGVPMRTVFRDPRRVVVVKP